MLQYAPTSELAAYRAKVNNHGNSCQGDLSMRSAFLIAVLVLVALGCGGGDSDRILQGTMTLSDTDTFWSHDEPCSGSGGYDDIDEGAQVVIKNEKAEIIATSNLGEGVGKDVLRDLAERIAELESRTPNPTAEDDDNDFDFELIACEFPFELSVPKADFYSIEVSHRGEISYSSDELADNGWMVELTLGD